MESERAGQFTTAGSAATDIYRSAAVVYEFYEGRYNDGADVDVFVDNGLDGVEGDERAAVEEERADITRLMSDLKRGPGKPRKPSSLSVSALQSKFSAVSVDAEHLTAKVVPDRIYSMAVAPLAGKLIAAAGDKRGNIGLWDPASSMETAVTCRYVRVRAKRARERSEHEESAHAV